MRVDRNRNEEPDVSVEPLIIMTESAPEITATVLSPPQYVMLDTVDVALVLQDDFRGDRDIMAGEFAGRVEGILAANRTLDDVIDFADCGPFTKAVPQLFGIQDTSAVHVPVEMLYCSNTRSGGG